MRKTLAMLRSSLYAAAVAGLGDSTAGGGKRRSRMVLTSHDNRYFGWSTRFKGFPKPGTSASGAHEDLCVPIGRETHPNEARDPGQSVQRPVVR